MKNAIVKNKLGIKVVAVTTCMALTMSTLSGCGNNEIEEVTQETDIQDDNSEILETVLDQQIDHSTDSDVDKEESVYVLADANGHTTEIIVSEWLKNMEGSETLEDISALENIINLKGNESYEKEGDKLIWNANGMDIRYQGTIQKELPVDVKVTYYLENEEISPEELAGKCGNIKIRFDYSNHEQTSINVDGKNENINVPFTVLSAMMLPVDNFTNIEVTNGRVFKEGDTNIVVGLGFPGLKDSLKLDDMDILDEQDIEIPDYVEVTAYAQDFSLDMTMSVVLSDVLSQVSLADDIDLSGVTDSFDELSDASTQLVDGSGELKDGITTLFEKSGEFGDGINALDEGLITYTDGVAELGNGISLLKDGTGTLNSGASQLAAGASSAKSGADQLVAGYEGTAEQPGAVVGAQQLSSGLDQCYKAVQNGLNTGLNQLSLMTGLDVSVLTKEKCSELALAASTNPTQVPVNNAYLSAMANKLISAASVDTLMIEGASLYNELDMEEETENITEDEETGSEEDTDLSEDDGMQINGGSDNETDPVSSDNTSVGTDSSTGDNTQSGSSLDVGNMQGDNNFAGSDSQNTNNSDSGNTQDENSSDTDNMQSGNNYDTDNTQNESSAAGNDQQNTDNSDTGSTKETDGIDPNSIQNEAPSGFFECANTISADEYAAYAASAQAQAAQQAAQFAAIAQIGTLSTSLTSLFDLQTALLQLDAGAGALYSGISQLYAGTVQLQTGLTQLSDGAGTLYGGTQELNSGAEDLQTGADTLTDASVTLLDGSSALISGKGQLIDGIETLEEGAVTLNDGMIQFDEEGISKITEGLGDGAEEFIDRLTAVKDAGNGYTTFTGLSEGKTGSVKFIIKTDAIKSETP